MNDNKEELREALQQIAEQNGITVDKVLDEIQLAIEEAMRSQEAEAREFWDSFSEDEHRPEPEEIMLALLNRIIEIEDV